MQMYYVVNYSIFNFIKNTLFSCINEQVNPYFELILFHLVTA